MAKHTFPSGQIAETVDLPEGHDGVFRTLEEAKALLGLQTPGEIAFYERALARGPVTWVPPVLVEQPQRRKSLPEFKPGPAKSDAGGTINTTYSNDVWGGVAWTPPSGKLFTEAQTLIFLPTGLAVLPGQKSGLAAYWVGIGGFVPGSNSLLQSGATGSVNAYGTHWTAWWEWFPGHEVDNSSFAVNSGDNLNVYVSGTIGSGSAVIHQLNETTNQAWGANITAPVGTYLDGTSAEFIVESHWDPVVYQGQVVPFLRGSGVTFANSYAALTDGTNYGGLPWTQVLLYAPGADGGAELGYGLEYSATNLQFNYVGP